MIFINFHCPDIIFPVLLFHVKDLQLVKGCQPSFDGYLTNKPTTRPGIDLQGGPSLEKNSVFSWLEKIAEKIMDGLVSRELVFQ